MQVFVEVIMPTAARRAVAELFGDRGQGRALLRTVRPILQPAPVRTETAVAAERLLAGAHRGYDQHVDNVRFIKVLPAWPATSFDYSDLEKKVAALMPRTGKGPDTGRVPTRP